VRASRLATVPATLAQGASRRIRNILMHAALRRDGRARVNPRRCALPGRAVPEPATRGQPPVLGGFRGVAEGRAGERGVSLGAGTTVRQSPRLIPRSARGRDTTFNATGAAPLAASAARLLRAPRGVPPLSWRTDDARRPPPRTRRPTTGSILRRRGGRPCESRPPDRQPGAHSFKRRRIRSSRACGKR